MDESKRHAALMGAMRRFGRINLTEVAGISRGEFHTLWALHQHSADHPGAEGMYVSALAEELHILPPAASRVLRGMEKKGLIRRTVDPADRRNTFIHITGAGETARETARSRVVGLMRAVEGRMGREQLQTLITLWTRLAGILEEEMERTEKLGPMEHKTDKGEKV